jgi:hypothetical protein
VGLSVEAVTAHAQGLLFFHHLTWLDWTLKRIF